MALWVSDDRGQSWRKERELTQNSPLNHAYARRPVNAHPDFYAFWADGSPDESLQSRLHFTDKAGDRVWRLPYEMEEAFEEPELVGP